MKTVKRKMRWPVVLKKYYTHFYVILFISVTGSAQFLFAQKTDSAFLSFPPAFEHKIIGTPIGNKSFKLAVSNEDLLALSQAGLNKFTGPKNEKGDTVRSLKSARLTKDRSDNWTLNIAGERVSGNEYYMIYYLVQEGKNLTLRGGPIMLPCHKKE